MIIICEPICRGISHEKVNAGFVFGLYKAYPKEEIVFFADKSHYKAVVEDLNLSGVKIKGLKCVPIGFNPGKMFSLEGLVSYYFLLRKLFDRVVELGENKIFFLSTSPSILYLIKRLKQKERYKKLNCTIVLHGELEDIANKEYKEPYTPPIKRSPVVSSSLFTLFTKLVKNPKIGLNYLCSVATHPVKVLYSRYTLFFKRKFRPKQMMEWKHSAQYKYISLSPHVTRNASNYVDTDCLNFNTIVLPIVFAKPQPAPKNVYIKFAVFGYGDSAQMHKMLTLLSEKKINKLYEIRIISMDSRGTEGFANVTRLSQGKVLTRREMERAARDIDVFMNLYDKTRHRFGCSLSIFESFSYLKPILHLSNPGYDYFNKAEKPVGFRTKNLNEFVGKMKNMIENFPRYKKQLVVFRKNILEYRKEYAIENNLEKLRKSFTFLD